jgi:hypothetical protein
MWTFLRRYGFCALLIVYAAYATYGMIDTSVSLNYARQGQMSDQEDADVLRDLLLGASARWNRTDFIKLVEKKFGNSPFGPNHIVKKERDQLEINGIIIQFNGQSISNVKFLGNGENYKRQQK